MRFTGNFNWRVPVKHPVVIAYKAGMTVLVKRTCAEDAVKAGKGIIVPRNGEIDERSGAAVAGRTARCAAG